MPHLLSYSFAYSPTHPPSHSLTHSHSLSHSLTHLTHSPTHSLTHSTSVFLQTYLCKLRKEFKKQLKASYVQDCTASFCSSQHVACCLAELQLTLYHCCLSSGSLRIWDTSRAPCRGGLEYMGRAMACISQVLQQQHKIRICIQWLEQALRSSHKLLQARAGGKLSWSVQVSCWCCRAEQKATSTAIAATQVITVLDSVIGITARSNLRLLNKYVCTRPEWSAYVKGSNQSRSSCERW